jgi:hypothetical protein
MTARMIGIATVGMWILSGWAFGQGASILEENGRVGMYALGTKISTYKGMSAVQSNLFRSTEGFEFLVDQNAMIREIRVSRAGMFTQRLVSIDMSTMEDVLKRYGTTKVDRQGEEIVLRYPVGKANYEILFSFENSSSSTGALRGRLKKVTLRNADRR